MILIYVGFQVILSLGLNLQWGVAGLLNLGYIGSMAAGAYVTAVVVLPKATATGSVHYVLGLHWPAWAAMICGVAAAGLVALIIGIVVLGRRLEAEYFAILTLIIVIALAGIATVQANLFNGLDGLINIPRPYGQSLSTLAYDGSYVGFVGIFALTTWFLARRVQRSPFGRLGRAVREDETAVQVFGRNPLPVKLKLFVLGAMCAGLAGSLTVLYVGAFAPASWTVGETVFALTCIMVGGSGSMTGGVVASAVIVTLFVQLPSLLPIFQGSPTVLAEIQIMATAVLLIAIMRWRPDGLMREPVGTVAKLSSRAEARRAGVRWLYDRARLEAAVAAFPPDRVTSSSAVATAELSSHLIASGRATVSGPPAIEVRGITKRFGGVIAVDSCSFELPLGSITGLVGPNGSGKSTVVELVSGFQAPDAGRVFCNGDDVTNWAPSKRAAAGLTRTFQTARIWSKLTVTENLLLAAPSQTREALWRGVFRVHATGRNEGLLLRDAHEILDGVGLWHLRDAHAGELSGGQRRLLELARIVMSTARVALLDEPLAGVNPVMGDAIVEQIRRLNRDRGMTVLLVEHNLKIVSALCPNVLAMVAGRVVASGTVQQLASSEKFAEAYLGDRRSAPRAKDVVS